MSAPSAAADRHHCAATAWGALLRPEEQLGAQASRLRIPLEQLLAWRTALLATAAPVLADEVEDERWTAVDLAVAPDSAAYAALVRGPLLDHLTSWTDRGEASNWSYLHKPPGVRLRVEGDSGHLRPALEQLLGRLGLVRGTTWEFSRYLPEVHLFGGRVGAALTSQVFTADSASALRLLRLRLADQAQTPPVEMSLVQLLLLTRAVTDDAWEQWDLWCRLRWTGRLEGDDPGVPLPELGEQALEWVRRAARDPLAVPLSGAEREIVRDVDRSAQAVARNARTLQRTGRLQESLRRIAPFWVVHAWNRAGFPLPVQQSLSRLVVAALDPRGPEVR